jgi:hypothetical protein
VASASPAVNEAIARLYSALAGSGWGNAAERRAADEAQGRWPGTSDQAQAARKFHAASAEQAVAARARGLLIGAAGYPCDPDPARTRPRRGPRRQGRPV